MGSKAGEQNKKKSGRIEGDKGREGKEKVLTNYHAGWSLLWPKEGGLWSEKGGV